MVALAEGTDQTTDLCAVPTCLGHGSCPVMTDLHELAGHLRRVRSQVQFERSQPSMTGRHVRLTAGRLAYSDLLQQACTMLHLPTDLASCSGVARDVEILRIEAALARYGIAT